MLSTPCARWCSTLRCWRLAHTRLCSPPTWEPPLACCLDTVQPRQYKQDTQRDIARAYCSRSRLPSGCGTQHRRTAERTSWKRRTCSPRRRRCPGNRWRTPPLFLKTPGKTSPRPLLIDLSLLAAPRASARPRPPYAHSQPY